MGSLALGLGLGMSGSRRPAQPYDVLCQAIANKVCVTAADKKGALVLAPHVVYRGNNEQYFLDAVVVAQDGKAPNKPKLDTFKVADLSAIDLTNDTFAPEAGFNPDDAKYRDKTVCVVQIV